jgi:hypothetical protein
MKEIFDGMNGITKACHPEVAPAALCKMRGKIICAIAQAVSRDQFSLPFQSGVR